jgi:hypothetical protein
MGQQRLIGSIEGKSPLGRPGCRWESNIKMDHREIVWRYELEESGSG